MKNKILLIVCSLFMVSSLANANWIASNTTVTPASPITACTGMTAKGTFSWFQLSSLPYTNDLHFATMKLLFPNVVNTSTGVPTLIDVATSNPIPNVTFTLNTSSGGSSWEATFGPGTIIQPFQVLEFEVTDLGVTDTTLSGLIVSNTIGFLSDPAGENSGDNGSSTGFSITANPSDLAQATSNDSLMQTDGSTLNYYDTTCRLISTVDDAVGGNVLGTTVSTVNLDGTASFHNGQPYVRRWYQITPTTNGPADVTLYVNQSDFDDYNSVVLPPYDSLPTTGSNSDPYIGNIHITKNDDAGLGANPIVLTPTSVNWNGNFWEITVATPGFSQFRVHSANPSSVPLSITYKDFTVTKQETSDLVSWTTVFEGNNKHFNVQRSSDAVNFETLGTVASKATGGFNQGDLNYSFVDASPMIGNNYYRLEQVDVEDKVSYTKTINIIWGTGGSAISIYPNPVKDVLNVDVSTDKVSQTEVKILDMSGRVVKSVLAKTSKGLNHITLELDELASGVYGVQVFEDNELMHNGKVRKN